LNLREILGQGIYLLGPLQFPARWIKPIANPLPFSLTATGLGPLRRLRPMLEKAAALSLPSRSRFELSALTTNFNTFGTTYKQTTAGHWTCLNSPVKKR
jgi:hypothetical protein